MPARLILSLLLLLAPPAGWSGTLARPDYFQTLVNPPCSHCVDESKRRAADLQPGDRVAAWTRGKYDGGAIPLRFFLVPYRVISDTYGVFIYDADAGFVRGFEPSLDFTFYGWHNGIMAIRHKDGTIYSALSGRAIKGPRQGATLQPIPTLETDWGYWLSNYPGTVAYHMYDKYQAQALPAGLNRQALRTRPKPDKRLGAEERVIGVEVDGKAKAYPLASLETHHVIRDKIGAQDVVVLWQPKTRTAAIYAPRMENEPLPERLKLEWNEQLPNAPFMDRETFSHWDVTGRALDGPLKGQALVWLPGVQCKWAAWSAEYPHTEIYSAATAAKDAPAAPIIARLIPGERLNWDSLWKFKAQIEQVASGDNITVLSPDGHKVTLQVTAATETYVRGWWGNLEDFLPGQFAYAIVKTNEAAQLELHALADEISIQAMSAPLVAAGQQSGKWIFRPPAKGSDSPLVLAAPATAEGAPELSVGSKWYLNSGLRAGERIVLAALEANAFENERAQRQTEHLKQAAAEGLLAQLLEADVNSDRVAFLVRRADSDLARTLHAGDKVQLAATREISDRSLVVAEVLPDYSRTRLILRGAPGTMKECRPGDWVRLRAPLPDSVCFDRPPDLGRFTERQKRIDYFLSTIYCSCGMMGTACAGHWNTLAACKLHGCGMPNLVTRLLGEWIDEGQTDPQILEALVKRQGELVLKQHQIGSPLAH